MCTTRHQTGKEIYVDENIESTISKKSNCHLITGTFVLELIWYFVWFKLYNTLAKTMLTAEVLGIITAYKKWLV